MPNAYIDFEYNQTNQMKFNLVSCAILLEDSLNNFWLHNEDVQKQALKKLLLSIRDTHILVSYNVIAEARSLISLGLNPIKFKWIDLETEWKMLTNHWNKFAYGTQLIDGEIKFTKPPIPKWKDEKKPKSDDNSKAPKNLIGACYKLTGIRLDKLTKDDTRNLILQNKPSYSDEEKSKILAYGATDVKVLPAMLKAVIEAYKTSKAREAIKASHLLYRGEVSARTALVTATGYPVNRKKAEAFAAAVPDILKDLAEDINSQFPASPPFRWNATRGAYSKVLGVVRKHVEASPYLSRWRKTDTGALSLSLDAFTDHYSYRHDYPRGNFFAQYIRYLKTNQNLNGFIPKSKNAKNQDTLFDFLGPDDRARSYLNPYGSQSSRYQPKATGYIPLKSAWMRSLIEPKSGKMIVGIDYASQEFLLAAILSQDETMFKAYDSGDPYLYLGKLAGAIPQDGTKEQYKKERDRFKSTTLGIGYLMGSASLAKKLTIDTGIPHAEADAEKLINLYFKAYHRYAKWIAKTQMRYESRGYLQLLDGWIMFGDNTNARSVSNCPIQGAGACILRKAIAFCQDEGLRVIIPLHDAIYCEMDAGDWKAVTQMQACLKRAFSYYFSGKERDWAEAVRTDINAWGPDLNNGHIKVFGLNIKTQKVYIDERAISEYEKFSKYFAR